MGSALSTRCFLPPKNDPPMKYPYEMIDTEDGNRIPLQFFNRRSEFTILYSHGNGDSLPQSEDQVKQLADQLETNIVWYDYPGYSISYNPDRYELKTSERNVYHSIEAVYSYMIDRLKISPEKIILLGYSIGSGPTVELAKRLSRSDHTKPAGVILTSAFISCMKVVMMTKSLLPIPGDIFVNRRKLHKISSPIFIIHGNEDDIVSIEHGKVLLSNVKKSSFYPPLWVDVGHIGVLQRKE